MTTTTITTTDRHIGAVDAYAVRMIEILPVDSPPVGRADCDCDGFNEYGFNEYGFDRDGRDGLR